MIKLYRAMTRYNNGDYEDVPALLVRVRRERPVAPYEELVANYENLDEDHQMFAREAADELFTQAEMCELLNHISEIYGDSTLPEWWEEKLPLSEDAYPYSALPKTKYRKHLAFRTDPDYPLNFRVVGVCDVNWLRTGVPARKASTSATT